MTPVDEHLDRQDGVIARHQVLACGGTPTFVARKLRRREWVVVHPGVYVNHTGPLTWRQRAWAAVLACWPAALAGWSAIRAHEGPGRRIHDDGKPIQVLVEHGRSLDALPGVSIRESRRFDSAVQVHLSPPRQHYDDAVIELADRASDELAAIAILADACGGRRTTADRLQDRIAGIPRLARRRLMTQVLRDIADGTCSVLEHAYLTRVERAHGLPRGLRQVAARDHQGRRVFRDVVYGGRRPAWRKIVELDGRLGHDSASDRDRDLERDLDAALDGAETVRLGYGQVLVRSCRTAAKLALLMQRAGWVGVPTTCPHCDQRDRRGVDQAG